MEATTISASISIRYILKELIDTEPGQYRQHRDCSMIGRSLVWSIKPAAKNK